MHLAVRTKSGGHQRLKLFVVPHICDPVMSQAYLPHSSHLSRLELAEVRQEPALSIDLLIGSDFYWEFVTGETMRGDAGPVAVNTTLGWVLSGPSGPADQKEHAVSPVSLVTAHTMRVEGITNKELDNTMKSFGELESFGIEQPLSDPAKEWKIRSFSSMA